MLTSAKPKGTKHASKSQATAAKGVSTLPALVGPTRTARLPCAVHKTTDKYAHGYTKHYEHHFHSLRRKKLKLLEIGIGGNSEFVGGASLLMWKDYFPKSEIFGLDIVDKSSLNQSRIKIFQGDQNDPAFLNDLGSRWGPFDIIIDDGSHVSEHVIASYTALFPHVSENGIYVIEDLLSSYDDRLGGSAVEFDNPRTSLGMLKTLIDDINYKYIPERKPEHYGDHILSISFYPKICFIQKGNNAMPDPYGERFVKRGEDAVSAR